MPTKLRKLKINRVDLVSAGANEQAVVTFFKRDGDAPTASDAHQDIEMYAEELVGAGWHQTMSDAISAVCRQRPEVYNAYRKAVSVSTPVRIKE